MNKAPSSYTLHSLSQTLNSGTSISHDGETWYPARPEGFPSLRSRFTLAWEVFTGKADVLRWPGKQ